MPFFLALGGLMVVIVAGAMIAARGRSSLLGEELYPPGDPFGPFATSAGGSGLPAPDPNELDTLFRQVMTLIDEAEARALSGCHLGRTEVGEGRCRRRWVNRFNRQRKRVVADFRRALRRYTGGGLAKLLSAGAELASSITGAQSLGAIGAAGGEPPD